MKTLVIYDSAFGNTELIARAIADALRDEGTADALLCEHGAAVDLHGVDLLVVGCPTQRHTTTPTIAALLDELADEDVRGRAVAAFDTRYHMNPFLSGSAARKIAAQLRRQGGVLLVPPESFFVVEHDGPLEDGEIERAAAWAATLREQIALHTC
jgi:flavodoxin